MHAHPDDESIGTGATMAKYAAQGARVTLVTCTLGELGEILPPGLAHLAAGQDDRLGEYRIGELDAACAALGVPRPAIEPDPALPKGGFWVVHAAAAGLAALERYEL